MRRKRALFIIVLILIGVGGITYFALNKYYDSKKKFKVEANNGVAQDIATPSIQEINKKYAGNADVIYGELMGAGFKKTTVKRYSEAITYFQAAANATKNQAFKDEADISVYYAAKNAGDSKLVADYEKLLGAKLQQTFNAKENAINPN